MSNKTDVQNLNTTMEPSKKLTPAEALARVRPGEHVEFLKCPHCGEPIAIYLPKPAAEPSPVGQSVVPR